jgi:hypothetical protein
MHLQLTLIARGLKVLQAQPADAVAAERSYIVDSRQLERVPWARAWSDRLRDLFSMQRRLRQALDGMTASASADR